MSYRALIVLFIFISKISFAGVAPETSATYYCQKKHEVCAPFKELLLKLNLNKFIRRACPTLTKYLPGDAGYYNDDLIHPISGHHLLVEVSCMRAAYNQSSLFFLFDSQSKEFRQLLFPSVQSSIEENLNHALADKKPWPDLGIVKLKIEYSNVVASRHYDQKAHILYAYSKTTGGGHAGHFEKFLIDAESLFPNFTQLSPGS